MRRLTQRHMYKKLLDDNALTQEEFEKVKKDILND